MKSTAETPVQQLITSSEQQTVLLLSIIAAPALPMHGMWRSLPSDERRENWRRFLPKGSKKLAITRANVGWLERPGRYRLHQGKRLRAAGHHQLWRFTAERFDADERD